MVVARGEGEEGRVNQLKGRGRYRLLVMERGSHGDGRGTGKTVNGSIIASVGPEERNHCVRPLKLT